MTKKEARMVEPIRNQRKINDMRRYLASNPRDHLLFVIGISSAFRISDLLKLQFKDVINETKKVHTHFIIKEQKTNKNNKILINTQLRKIIEGYVETHFNGDLNQYLFKSRKGNNRPITRVSAYRILKEAANAVNIRNFGTHSLRKTFAYHYYKNTGDIALLQEILNHSSSKVTLRYIGALQDEIDRSIESYSLL